MLYDKDIREALFDFLEEKYGKTRMLEELSMGASRADIVMVTETALYGIEIKSDADSYSRLPRQVMDYDCFFDYNLAVVGSHHALHIGEHLPEHWGIITVEEREGKADFYFLRKPEKNPGLSLRCKLSLLWRPELAQLQQKNGMHAYKRESKKFVIEKISETVEEDRLREQLSELLFERDYTTIGQEINAFRVRELSLPPRKKYESGGGGSLRKAGRLRRKKSAPELLVKRIVRGKRKKKT